MVRTLVAIFFGLVVCGFVANRPPENFFDTLNYIEMVENATTGLDVNAEQSFIIISRVCFWAGTGAVGVFFFYAILGIIPKITLIISRLPYPFLALLIYFSGGFILQEMVQVRVGAALGMLWLSLFLFSDEKKLTSCLAALLAVLLHYSALVVVILAVASRFFLWKRYVDQGRLGNNFMLLGLLVIAISYLCGAVIIDLTSQHSALYEYLPVRYADGYLVSTEDHYGVGRILFVILLSVVAMCALANGWLPKEFPYLVAAFLTFASIVVLSVFQSQPVVGSRLVDLFISFMPILIVGFIKTKPRYGWPVFAGIAAAQIVNIVFYATYYKISD